MRFRPTAVGYVRSDISGARQAWDEERIRSRAKRLGYDFAKIVVADARSGGQAQGGGALLAGLKSTLRRLDAEAVIVPSAKHFAGEQVPSDLVQLVDVITVEPEETYARWAIPPIPPEKS
ncbi:hypothetical protein [Nocardia sp. NPDC020380]|uniref:hypothetical protein n=1 Tax=Nocardia sp. NPDC020380 TaxID=3364309 RepID=UPI0037892BFD